jgi:hypothetical protein
MKASMIDRFIKTYQQLNIHSLGLLSQLYRDDVRFQDPFRLVTGLPALTDYFAELYRHVESCSFAFEDTVLQTHAASLTWTMSLKHPRLNGGELVTVPGSTWIKFDEKVFYHRDYFDGGAMLYE